MVDGDRRRLGSRDDSGRRRNLHPGILGLWQFSQKFQELERSADGCLQRGFLRHSRGRRVNEKGRGPRTLRRAFGGMYKVLQTPASTSPVTPENIKNLNLKLQIKLKIMMSLLQWTLNSRTLFPIAIPSFQVVRSAFLMDKSKAVKCGSAFCCCGTFLVWFVLAIVHSVVSLMSARQPPPGSQCDPWLPAVFHTLITVGRWQPIRLNPLFWQRGRGGWTRQ